MSKTLNYEMIVIPSIFKIGKYKDFFECSYPIRSYQALTPIKLKTAVPCLDFVILEDVKIDEISIFEAEEDAFIFHEWLDLNKDFLPKIKYGISIKGRYTGLIPSGLKKGDHFLFKCRVYGSYFYENETLSS